MRQLLLLLLLSGQAQATIALLVHAVAGSTNTSTATTPAVDTTGATLIVVTIGIAAAQGNTIADSAGNTYTARTQKNGAAGGSRIWYVASPTNSATLTVTVTSVVSSIEMTAWSGTATSSPFDVEGAGGTGNTTVQPGSVTPSQNNSLIITGIGSTNTNTFTIDSSFTISDQFGGSGTAVPSGQAYLIQGTAAAVNPTWTASLGFELVSTIAVFKPGAAVISVRHRVSQ